MTKNLPVLSHDFPEFGIDLKVESKDGTAFDVSWNQECRSCKGTGLYVGMAERDGAAVVCGTCKGKGERRETHRFNRSSEMKFPEGVTHVWGTNPGIVLSGLHTNVLTGGVPLADHLANPNLVFELGNELRSHVCPAWWLQSASGAVTPELGQKCSAACVTQFSRCRHYGEKAECWKLYDDELKAAS